MTMCDCAVTKHPGYPCGDIRCLCHAVEDLRSSLLVRTKEGRFGSTSGDILISKDRVSITFKDDETASLLRDLIMSKSLSGIALQYEMKEDHTKNE